MLSESLYQQSRFNSEHSSKLQGCMTVHGVSQCGSQPFSKTQSLGVKAYCFLVWPQRLKQDMLWVYDGSSCSVWHR